MMHVKVLALSTAVLAGCTAVIPELDSALDPVSQPLLATSIETGNTPVLEPAQTGAYASIIETNFAEVRFRFDSNFEELRINRLGAQQTRLPKIIPGASANVNGSATLQVGVRQPLFNKNSYEAQFRDADIQAVRRQIILLQALNDEVSEDIETYFSYHRNLERTEFLADLAVQLEDLLGLAETRFDGGIGTASEVSLFQLELTDIETEAQISRSNAAVDLAELEDMDVSSPPQPFKRLDVHLPIDVLFAIADRDQRKSDLHVARVANEPKVVLEAQAGYDFTTGLPTSRAGVSVDTDEIELGGDTDILLAEQNLFLAEREVVEAFSDLESDIQRTLEQISALEDQQVQTDLLAQQAQGRLDAFDLQFQSGQSSLTEAASLIDVLRGSL